MSLAGAMGGTPSSPPAPRLAPRDSGGHIRPDGQWRAAGHHANRARRWIQNMSTTVPEGFAGLLINGCKMGSATPAGPRCCARPTSNATTAAPRHVDRTVEPAGTHGVAGLQ